MIQNEEYSNWQDQPCEDLTPILHFLEERYRIKIWRADKDSNGDWSRIYLNKNLSPKMILKLREQLANTPHIQAYQGQVICILHQVRLVSRRYWVIDQGKHIKGQSIGSFIGNMAILLLFVIGGFFLVRIGNQEGSIRNIIVGILNIVLFGLGFALGLKELIQYIRRK